MRKIKTTLGTVTGALIGVPVSATLEIIGATTAWWGGSDMIGERSEDNANAWRLYATLIGVAGLACYICRHSYVLPNPARKHVGFFSSLRHSLGFPWEAIRSEFGHVEENQRLGDQEVGGFNNV